MLIIKYLPTLISILREISKAIKDPNVDTSALSDSFADFKRNKDLGPLATMQRRIKQQREKR